MMKTDAFTKMQIYQNTLEFGTRHLIKYSSDATIQDFIVIRSS